MSALLSFVASRAVGQPETLSYFRPPRPGRQDEAPDECRSRRRRGPSPLYVCDIPTRRTPPLTRTDTFPRLVVDGVPEEADWSVTRKTKNADTKQGIEDPTSPDIRCYNSENAGGVASVPAGSTIHYISTQQVNHPGPTQYYLAKVPEGQAVEEWDGSGAVWARFHTEMPSVDENKQLTFPGQSTS